MKNAPDILFDGFSVYNALSDKAKSRTSPENVADVLDAVVRLMRVNVFDAKIAADMLDNPGDPNQALADLLKLN